MNGVGNPSEEGCMVIRKIMRVSKVFFFSFPVLLGNRKVYSGVNGAKWRGANAGVEGERNWAEVQRCVASVRGRCRFGLSARRKRDGCALLYSLFYLEYLLVYCYWTYFCSPFCSSPFCSFFSSFKIINEMMESAT